MKLSPRQLSLIVVVKLMVGQSTEAAMARAVDEANQASPIAAQPATGRAFRIASKAFTESVILGEVVALTVSAAGVVVAHRAALGGTRL